jgi:hypothetical protein
MERFREHEKEFKMKQYSKRALAADYERKDNFVRGGSSDGSHSYGNSDDDYGSERSDNPYGSEDPASDIDEDAVWAPMRKNLKIYRMMVIMTQSSSPKTKSGLILS